MISRRTIENLAAAIIFVLFAAALYMSFGYGPRARMVPVPIAVLGMLLVAVQIIWQNLRSTDDLQIDTVDLFAGRPNPRAAAGAGDARAPDGTSESEARGWRRWVKSEIAAFAVVGVFLVLIFVMGPLISIFIFLVGYLTFSKYCGFLRALSYGAVCFGALYLMFGVVLEVDLNRGLALPLINQIVRF